MAKANKDGWIRHRGGKCPFEAGTLVDVKYRDGEVNIAVPALTGQRGSTPRSAADWSQESRDHADIMAYRLHKPENKPAPVSEPKGKTLMPIFETGAGPLEWRDRIRQIDAEEAFRNLKHRTAIEALEEERLSLVQKLEDEGFKLIEAKPACDGMPAEDMSDYRNWRIGDIAEVLSTETFGDDELRVGDKVPITGIDRDGTITAAPGCWGFPGKEYKFHSRP